MDRRTFLIVSGAAIGSIATGYAFGRLTNRSTQKHSTPIEIPNSYSQPETEEKIIQNPDFDEYGGWLGLQGKKTNFFPHRKNR